MKTKRILPAFLTLSVISLSALISSQAAVILVDFGNTSVTNPVTPVGSSSSVYYNNVTGSGVTNLALVDSTNAATGFTLTAGGFNAGAQGNTSPTSSLGLFAVPNVMQDYAYVDIGTRYSFTLNNLDTSLSYSFAFTASRAGAANRDTIYRAAGTTTVESPTFTTIVNNTTDFVTINNITPTGSGNNGSIILSFISGTGNDSFSYLGALQVTTAAIPEPSTFVLLGAAGTVLMASRRRRAQA